MKYKVSDNVVIRNDLKAGKKYGYYTCTNEMGALKGKTVKIVRVDEEGIGNYGFKGAYEIDAMHGEFWTDEMIKEKSE